jgi:hypothetical protein
MDEQNEHEQPGEVSSSPSQPPSRIPGSSSSNRVQKIITLGVLAIVVLVILGTLTALKNIVGQQAGAPTPTPVPTIAPGDDLFYISTAQSGAT